MLCNDEEKLFICSTFHLKEIKKAIIQEIMQPISRNNSNLTIALNQIKICDLYIKIKKGQIKKNKKQEKVCVLF